MIDQFPDTSGRIPHIGDRVRVRPPNAKPYWARLRGLYKHAERGDLVAILEDENNGGERNVMTEYVTRAADKDQKVRPANETSAHAEALRRIAKRRGNKR